MVYCAVGGVRPQSGNGLAAGDKYGVPRLAFGRLKMDRSRLQTFSVWLISLEGCA